MEIALRPLSEADLETVRNWRNSPEVARYMYTGNHITAAQQQAWFQRVNADPTKRFWMIEYAGRAVGVVNVVALHATHRSCHLGIYFGAQDIRGKGLGRGTMRLLLARVFGELGMNKIVAEAFSWNGQAIALYEKMGFRQEGVFRQEIWKDGKFHDVVRLALLAEEWNSAEEVKP
ncbi:MAG: UDP-4-amino-4,6-dideoxy-N-acetyl-beta-L-altrosamine N-acetyltransferase [Bacteroidota bacterium]